MSDPSVPDPCSAASQDQQTNEVAQILEQIRAEYDKVVLLIGQQEAGKLLAETIWSKEDLAWILKNGWSQEDLDLLSDVLEDVFDSLF